MPIVKEQEWNAWVANNTDPYGKACIDVARCAMELIDEGYDPTDCRNLIFKADDKAKTGGITGFMAGCVAVMISECHSRGEEFRRAWNKDTQISHEGDTANEKGGVLNPAILNIQPK